MSHFSDGMIIMAVILGEKVCYYVGHLSYNFSCLMTEECALHIRVDSMFVPYSVK